jgi:hypothetical protein
LEEKEFRDNFSKNESPNKEDDVIVKVKVGGNASMKHEGD